MGGSYILVGSNLEKCWKIWKNGRFSGRIRTDWRKTARVDMAGLGSIGYTMLMILDYKLYTHSDLPYGLVVRIPAFHAGGPGSI